MNASRESEPALPVEAAEFESLMAPFCPFEPAPRLAVAVSGGADSMALALLLDGWARRRGGAILALTVDHGLRAESAWEARWVNQVLSGFGIAHDVLSWCCARPDKATQAAARTGRYALLVGRCAAEGIVHLALAHHRDDQGETFLLRIQEGSGVSGLAGMAAQREVSELRLLRPLLEIPKARLQATLRARGVAWVEDPSNRDKRYARAQLRRIMPSLAEAGVDAARITEVANLLGRARCEIERAVDELLGDNAWMHPAGFAWLAGNALTGVPEPVARDALARLLCASSGQEYPPRTARLDRLYRHLLCGSPRARTLGGCRVVPRRGDWLVVREAGRMPRERLFPGESRRYDGRFAMNVSTELPQGLWIGPLGRAGWAALTAQKPSLRAHPVPPAARPALPAVFDETGVREVPALVWRRAGASPVLSAWVLHPIRALTRPGFTVAR